MSIPARLLGLSGTRAGAPVTKKPQRPQVATGNTGWTAPGSPMQAIWNSDSAIQVGYYGYIYAYRCARTIATTIAALPFRAGPNASTPTSYSLTSPLAQLLGPPPGTPAPNISSKQLLIHSIVSYLITGKMAWETPTAPGSNVPVSLWPLIVSKLSPIPTQDGSVDWFSGFQYNLNARTKNLTPNQVFYAWRPSQTDWRQPESVLQAAALPLSLGVALDKYMSAFMRNGMVGSKMVVTPSWDEQDMRRAFQDQWLSEMTGYDNAGRVGFAEYEDDGAAGGQGPPNVQVLDMGTKPIDAEITALHQWVRDTICDAFGVPVSIIGQASERTYANSDQEHKNYWTGTILGLLEELLDHINMGLAPRFGNDVGWFDLSGVEALQPPPRFQQQMPDILVAADIVAVEEVREDLGLAPELPTGAAKAQTEPIPAVDDTPSTQGGSATGAMRSLEMLADVLTSGERYDTSPIGLKPNWITSVGGLPLFARAVAHALIRDGHTESEAIQIAIGVIEDWAHGSGNVTAKTRAKAAATVAEWEAKRVAAHATRDGFGGIVTEGSDGVGALVPKVSTKAEKAHLPTPGPTRGVCGLCGKKVTAKVHTTALGASKRVSGMRHAGPVDHAHVRTGHYSGARRITSKQMDAHATALEPAAETALKTVFAAQRKATIDRLQGNRGKAMIRDAMGSRDFNPTEPRDSHGEWSKIGGILDRIVGDIDHSHGDETRSTPSLDVLDPTKTKSVDATVKALSVTADGKSLAATVRGYTSSTRANVPKLRNDTATYLDDPSKLAPGRAHSIEVLLNAMHTYDAGDKPLFKGMYQEGYADEVLDQYKPGTEFSIPIGSFTSVRKVGEGFSYGSSGGAVKKSGPHVPVLVVWDGHKFALPVQNLSDHRWEKEWLAGGRFRVVSSELTKRNVIVHIEQTAERDASTPSISEYMSLLFGEQRRANAADAGTRQEQDDSDPAPLVDASQVFDWQHWVAKTQEALQPTYAAIGSVTKINQGKFGTSQAASDAIIAALNARSGTLAQTVSTTTLQQIQQALANAVINGETVAQMTGAVNKIFDQADSTRAALISRTEVIGAMNTAADVHAQALGPSVVAGKEWIATMDDRTRPMHREADGQVRAMGVPFTVGGSLMEHPGDPTAPPDEVCNCRCTTGYLTPAEYAQRSGVQLPTASPIAA